MRAGGQPNVLKRSLYLRFPRLRLGLPVLLAATLIKQARRHGVANHSLCSRDKSGNDDSQAALKTPARREQSAASVSGAGTVSVDAARFIKNRTIFHKEKEQKSSTASLVLVFTIFCTWFGSRLIGQCERNKEEADVVLRTT